MVLELQEKFKCFDDPNFKFDPKYHKYTYNNKKYTSVTQFLKNFHAEFDQEYWSKKKAGDYGVPQEWLLQEWKEKNERANEIGTATHNWIENYFKGIYQQLPNDIDIIDRINKFNKIFAQKLYKLIPVRFELRVFSKKYPIAGTIDSIFIYKGKLFIVDYKTNGDFRHDDHPKGKYQKLLHPFESEYQNHLNEYSIQVALYAIILREWGFDIRGGYLLYLGPYEDAKIYRCKNYIDKIEKYLENHNWE